MSSLHRSFRWRLALLATAVCGIVLGAFSWLVWGHLHEAATGHIDSEIERVAHHHIHRANDHGQEPVARGFPFLLLGGNLQDTALWLRSSDGETMHRSEGWPEELTAAALPNAEAGAISYATCTIGGRTFRLGRLDDERASLTVSVDLVHFHRELHDLQLHWCVALLAALLLAALGSWWHARRALAPVQALTASLEEIDARDLDRRVPETDGFAEFQRLVTVCNGMLERLERSFSQAVRFSADASHEMKTPLTIMQGHVESALQSLPDGSPAQAALAAQLDEIGRLKSLVRKLLLLSQADAGELHVQRDAMDLSDAVLSLADDLRILAPGLDVRTEVHLEVHVMADEGLVAQLLQNLGANAIKYNRDDGRITLRLRDESGRAVLTVASTGEPIRGDGERLFDRFYRRDAARSRKVDGLGLGLSLSREIARAHGGELRFAGSTNGANEFELVMPLGATE